MPNLQNAKKALRQAKKRAARNLTIKNAYKKAVKTVTKSFATASTIAVDDLKLAQKKLGKAVKAGVINKNTAARKVSSLMKKANTVKK